ncbi:hypothetical protein [Methanobrevibacter filiformis]|uniref:Uncharacterized protein n=1 Tax=Methanobrevibacter filiformis TaxID=55758 RepID=A0A166EPX2_9EURY|nr:hypothetical protein [Methanobrevibacter filiformis]KZX16883.1 hypothetical protein MBFIL_04630 [Methanobrevibacter filiformis]
MNRDELIKKSETCILSQDNDIQKSCETFLKASSEAEKEVGISEEEAETYLKMAENLKSTDVQKALILALKIEQSKDIKDTEVKNEAARLIRAIEMS